MSEPPIRSLLSEAAMRRWKAKKADKKNKEETLSSEVKTPVTKASTGDVVASDAIDLAGLCKDFATAHLTTLSRRSEELSDPVLGVTTWDGAFQERNKVEAYIKRFSPTWFAGFDESIWMHYRYFRQNDYIHNCKNGILQHLLQTVLPELPAYEVKLYAVGSTTNRCGGNDSDLDLCLVLFNRDGTITDDKAFATARLCQLFEVLRKQMHLFANFRLVRTAAVPIITFSSSFCKVDIGCNNISGVRNSHLIHYYARIDDRFPALCLIIKHWATNLQLNCPRDGTFNSYSFNLMVLHYLQCGIVPAILPNLQHLYPDMFGEEVPLSELNLSGEFKRPLPSVIANEQTVGELLIGFFKYYSKFNFEKDAISVKKGSSFLRNTLPAETAEKPVYIEEPCDSTGSNAGRNVQPERMSDIRRAFQKAADALSNRTPPHLSLIGLHSY